MLDRSFTLRFLNVVCSSEGRTFSDLEAAIAAGRQAGFEFAIYQGDRRVAYWTVFGGLRVST